MKIPKTLKWIAASLARVLIIAVHVIRIPFAVIAKLSGEANEMLREFQHDVRNSCPWPWMDDLNQRWDAACHEERKRLMTALRGAE